MVSYTLKTGGAICWRLLADALPPGADSATVALSASTPGGCPTPITRLFEHDHHAAGHDEAYVERVLEDTAKAIKALKGKPQPTGYKIYKVNV